MESTPETGHGKTGESAKESFCFLLALTRCVCLTTVPPSPTSRLLLNFAKNYLLKILMRGLLMSRASESASDRDVTFLICSFFLGTVSSNLCPSFIPSFLCCSNIFLSLPSCILNHRRKLVKNIGGAHCLNSSSHCLPLPSPSSFICS